MIQETYSDLAGLSFDNQTPPPDDNQTRFGLSLVFNIPLLNQTPSNFFGDYNKKIAGEDGLRHNVENREFFPRLVLMPFVSAEREIPSELLAEAVLGAPEEFQGAFDVGQALRAGAGAVRKLRKTARQCAETVLAQFRQHGFVVFENLTGLQPGAAFRLVNLVLPVGDETIFPKSEKLILGYRVAAPFLSEIIEFLHAGAVAQISRLAETEAEASQLEQMRVQLINAAETAVKTGNSLLDDTEAEMASDKAVKKTYDKPNYQMWDAPEPPDLVYLAHTNRVPVSERQVAAAREMSKDVSAPMTEMVSEFTKALGNLTSQQQANAQTSLTPEMLEKFWETKKEDLRREILAENAARTAATKK